MTDLGTLAVIVGVGILGPLVSGLSGNVVPVVVGEILAGVAIGGSGFGWIDPADPTLVLISNAGFAVLMFTVGMHLPLHDKRLRSALGPGALAALIAAAAAIPAGLLAARLAGSGHAALYMVILASSSAAVALPVFAERKLSGRAALIVTAQITIADIVAVIAVPFAVQPDRVGKVVLGSLAVIAAIGSFFALMSVLRGSEWFRRLRKSSKKRSWALDLRIDLAVLLGLAWLAQRSGTSILIAGFGTGLVVGALGGPNRLSLEVRGLAEGFLVPFFFVALGARLDLHSLVSSGGNLALAGSLAVLSVAVHLAASLISRQRAWAGLAASAQLGVPAAVVALGLSQGILDAGQGAAIIAAALISLAVCSVGVAGMARAESGAA